MNAQLMRLRASHLVSGCSQQLSLITASEHDAGHLCSCGVYIFFAFNVSICVGL